MQTVYIDKKERLRAWFTPRRTVAVTVTLAVLIFAPLWRDSVEGRFVFEPNQDAVLRAAIPGFVEQVTVVEGQRVQAGEILMRLRNFQAESEAGRAQADYTVANARFVDAQLHLADFMQEQHDREQAYVGARQAGDRVARLTLRSPFEGEIVTPKPQDLTNSTVKEGTLLLEVADVSALKARLYIPEFDLRKVEEGRPASLLTDDRVRPLSGTVESILPASEEIQQGLMQKTEYKGIRPPKFYVVTIVVPNDGSLRIGMPGTAKVYHGYRSLAGMLWEPLWNTISRKVW